MKIIVFDVGNAACSVVSSPNKYGLMVDCGSHSEKENPVDLLNVKEIKDWLGLKLYVTQKGVSYKLGLLHITHPDDDHVRNAKKVKKEFEPYLLHKREFEEFPDGDQINSDYKEYIDKKYRGSNPETINWGFEINKVFKIPMDILKSNEDLNKKLRNNSSILRYIKYNGIRILFTGDLEKEGWNWFIENDKLFISYLKEGIDILIAPHHGHKSGFPKALFDITGNVKVVIHSKGSEGNIEGTDIATQYSTYSDGVIYKNLNDENCYVGKVLTTRSNGHIFIEVLNNDFKIYTAKASSNHKKVNC